MCIKSSCCTPQTYTMVYVNYISINAGKTEREKKKVYNYRRKSLKNYINFVVEALVIEEKEKGV